MYGRALLRARGRQKARPTRSRGSGPPPAPRGAGAGSGGGRVEEGEGLAGRAGEALGGRAQGLLREGLAEVAGGLRQEVAKLHEQPQGLIDALLACKVRPKEVHGSVHGP